MIRLGILLVLGFGAWQWWTGSKIFSQDRRPSHRIVASTDSRGTCEGKAHCLVVYLAPWCPHCQSYIPNAKRMLEGKELKSLGVRVVIGKAKPNENIQMQSEISPLAEVDHDGSLAALWRVDRFPFFLVLDKEGASIIEGPEAREYAIEKFGG
jgi:thiol-disulfide isomerase/thioredoxin